MAAARRLPAVPLLSAVAPLVAPDHGMHAVTDEGTCSGEARAVYNAY
eukprot:gene23038-12388_t